MLRNFAAIGFLFLSAGQLSAESIPAQNTSTQSSIQQALSQFLHERSTWGTVPSQFHPDTSEAPLTLEAYLARRDAWNTPAVATVEPGPGSAEALKRYLARRDTWGTSPAANRPDVTQAQIHQALHKLLAMRESWGSEPSTIQPPGIAAVRGPSEAVALKAYLAERDGWGTSPVASRPEVTQTEIRNALLEQLATRESWGTGPVIANAGPPLAVAITPESTIREAQQALLGEPAGPSAEPVFYGTRDVADLEEFLARRVAWGQGPTSDDRDAETRSMRVQLPAEELDRRAQTARPETRVATANFGNTRTDSLTCTEAVQQITGSSVIQFGVGSSRLTSKSRRNLKQLADAARDCPNLKIRVEGHTDSAGDAARNQALSEARAASVADYLASTGLDGVALEAIGFGQSRPLVSNTTRALRAQNRRIELTVLTN